MKRATLDRVARFTRCGIVRRAPSAAQVGGRVSRRHVARQGDEVGRGFRVGGAHERRAREDERRDRGQRAVARLGRVRQGQAVDETRERDDRVLVGDDQGFASARLAQGRGQGRPHAGGDVTVGLTPRGAQRVAVVLEVLGVGQHRAIRVDGKAFEDVVRLDEARIGGNTQAVGGGRRRGRQLGTQERRGNDASDVRTRFLKVVGRASGHLMPQLREPKSGQPPVENTVGVVHFAVAHDVNNGAVHNAQV